MQQEVHMRREFTLIELLVVIAIIAILASMLLPSLQQAKLKAKQAQCTTNLKQLHLGVEMYADEKDEWLIVGGGGAQYINTLWPYVHPELASAVGGMTEWNARVYLCSPARDTAFRCPALPASLSTGQPFGGFGWNYYYLGYLEVSFAPRIKRQQIEQPSETLMMGDTKDVFDAALWFQNCHLYATGIATIGPGDRHNRGINVVYADGHTAWHTRVFLLGHERLYWRDK
ncbi:MAG: hypothetical protein A3K19_32020 [Lentisphaerae bacterium RIFOXYB12_FULL_65_16]|nr:MAG: hypothetical protein A3K18_10800 [Lentisphaerae bacterium RIFOXYA12_64_32]OGV88729.1 MAG: hypothetical protein A3K19_32020 [Lentisphaerae bacterium RIFOXYB12_FULL_65_16]